MPNRLRQHLPVLLTAVIVATVMSAGPALARAAYDVVNADRVDGRDAVGAGATARQRAGNLVATGRRGTLPNDIIGTAPNAQLLDGLDSRRLAHRAHLPAVGRAGAAGVGTLTNELATHATLTLDVPRRGFVLVTAEATFNARESGSYVYAQIRNGFAGRDSTYWDAGDVDNRFDQTQQTTTVLPVRPGTRTFVLEMYEPVEVQTTAQYTEATLTAIYFPRVPGTSTTTSLDPATRVDANRGR